MASGEFVARLRKANGSRIWQAVFNGLVTKLPSLAFGWLRVPVLRAAGARIEQGVRLGKGVRVLGPSKLHVGAHVSVAHSAVLDARGGLWLGAGSLIGFETVVLTYTHASADPMRPVHHQGVEQAPVVIGENSWTGARCLVLPGASVGSGTILGALSVTSGNLDDRAIYVGSPARKVRER